MKHAMKLAAVVGISLPVFFGTAASAAPVADTGAVVTPAAEDNPVAVLIGQMVVTGNEVSGNADRNQ